MTQQYPLRILSVSFYGAPVAGAKQFSGALGRQKDYAEYLDQYVVVVPGLEISEEQKTDHGDGLILYALPSTGYLSFFLSVMRRVKELHAEYKFDYIFVDNPHLAGILGATVKRMLGIPLVVNSMADMPHNEWYKAERVMNHFKHFLICVALAQTDFLRVSTQAEVKRMQEHGFPKNKLLHMPFYIDTEGFRRNLRAAGGARRDNTVLFVGRLGEQKDLRVLLRAFAHAKARVESARLVLVGGGPLEAQLTAYARELGIDTSVTFTGAIPYDEVARHFAEASLFAISSLYEGTCMVLHEAGLAKLPIVSTDFAGAKDYVRDGVEGYLAPVRDHEALGERIADVLSKTPAERATMGAAACARAEDYSREYALGHWDALCKRLVEYKT